ncbi:hypothetical protein [Thalassotalea sp. PLHSN55]|uniref:hypothetical protein n=1 Tax=Thalassotalea sp. PLHSN55 TaxID=3435888 RepID=UPI003F856263
MKFTQRLSIRAVFTKPVIITLCCLSISACGGGGGGESSSSASATTQAPTPAPVTTPDPMPTPDPAPDNTPNTSDEELPDPNAVYESTAELVAAKSFLIAQEYQLEISYQNDANRQAYLSVCTEFSQGSDGIYVNYNSCLLRAPISGDFSKTLTVANDKDKLVMAIWYLDDVNTPRYETWENTNGVNEEKTFHVN